MRIDSHQHFWRLDRGDYDWITPEMTAIYRDFLPQDLEAHLDANGIDKSIVVQAAPTLGDTEFMLGLADRSDRIAGVVGWIDLAGADYRQQLETFRSHPKFAGFRVMIQELERAEDVLEPAFVEALRYAAAEDVPVDLLLRSGQLPAVLQLLEQVPGLRGVIDHLAKPEIASGQWDPWSPQMVQAASHKNIYCKLSGMVTEADARSWKPEQFVRYVRHIVQAFGPDRVMFGSDWPVCLLAASYDQVVDVFAQALPEELSEADKANIYGGNALRFYKLESSVL
ncbi:hypothetical protein PAESOLCIP111_02815 [Paenibacillus solanacearum]|uniref:Amidohydrolase-related domain-containing protein n=1 Tax=Paenibacillus solanacearum TaxID=2048548 RepID=A0A916K1F0_9BACL|nr:amidohydrolase family protein [Paenibacillus solanacearum]CAG7626298.1 hypothetical protein PAESOLCIP111_02815 [Paenibacillus solanacearum]